MFSLLNQMGFGSLQQASTQPRTRSQSTNSDYYSTCRRLLSALDGGWRRAARFDERKRVHRYRKMDKEVVMESKGEPHVFAVCAKSLHEFNIPGSDINLSFVISGESADEAFSLA